MKSKREFRRPPPPPISLFFWDHKVKESEKYLGEDFLDINKQILNNWRGLYLSQRDIFSIFFRNNLPLLWLCDNIMLKKYDVYHPAP